MTIINGEAALSIWVWRFLITCPPLTQKPYRWWETSIAYYNYNDKESP